MKKLEHIGIAVEDLEAAEKVFGEVLGSPAYKREEVAGESVLTSFFQAGSAKIELLVPTSEDSAIARHLEKRGAGLHHIAFHVDDLEAELERLQSLGYRVVTPPKEGADGKRIAFLHPGDTARVLIELCTDV
ncbi:MAG: methylmalonyl-CoA epimerase [Flavobacteriales bacterium]|jgi:methylmalonyl-CoA/ethylmalonyl-CoA epimerase|nr:methylmalonyl-CoA epimerase [Flavobacteriales bacterium]